MDVGEDDHRLTSRGVATRARIIEVAADLVRNNGAAGTGLGAVMASAGVSKSQLYHYFDDKEALIAAVVEWQTTCVLAANAPLLERLDTLDDLWRWRDALLSGVETTGGAGGCPLGSLVGELAEHPRQRAALAEGFMRWQDYFRAAFERLRASGELAPSADPEKLAMAVLAALQGGLLLAQASRSSAPLASALDMALAFVSSQQPAR